MDEDGMTMGAASMAPSERKHVLLDDHRYFDEDEHPREEINKPKRLPRGTSKYQAAWFLGDVSDSGSDLESVVDDDDESMDFGEAPAAGPADGHFDDATPATKSCQRQRQQRYSSGNRLRRALFAWATAG